MGRGEENAREIKKERESERWRKEATGRRDGIWKRRTVFLFPLSLLDAEGERDGSKEREDDGGKGVRSDGEWEEFYGKEP